MLAQQVLSEIGDTHPDSSEGDSGPGEGLSACMRSATHSIKDAREAIGRRWAVDNPGRLLRTKSRKKKTN